MRESAIDSARVHGVLQTRQNAKYAAFCGTLAAIGGVGWVVLNVSTTRAMTCLILPLIGLAILLDGFGLLKRTIPPQSRALVLVSSVMVSLATWYPSPRMIWLAVGTVLSSIIMAACLSKSWLESYLWHMGPVEIQAGRYRLKDLDTGQSGMDTGALDDAAMAWSQGQASERLYSLLTYQGIKREVLTRDRYALMLSWRHGYIYAAQDLETKKSRLARLEERSSTESRELERLKKRYEELEAYAERLSADNQSLKEEIEDYMISSKYLREKEREDKKEMERMKTYYERLLGKLNDMERDMDMSVKPDTATPATPQVLYLGYTPQTERIIIPTDETIVLGEDQEEKEDQEESLHEWLLSTSGGACPEYPDTLPKYISRAVKIKILMAQGMTQNAAAKELGLSSGLASRTMAQARAWAERQKAKRQNPHAIERAHEGKPLA